METFIAGSMALGWVEFMTIWISSWVGRFDDDDIIWITKNYDANWCITRFLVPHALAYERLCEHINGPGLALMLVVLSLLTYPVTICMGIFALVAYCVRRVWKWFCKAFAREQQEEEEQKDITVTGKDGWYHIKVIDWSK